MTVTETLVECKSSRDAVEKASLVLHKFWEDNHGVVVLDEKAVKTDGARLLRILVEHEKPLVLVLLKVEILWGELLQEHALADHGGTESEETHEQWVSFATWLQQGDVSFF